MAKPADKTESTSESAAPQSGKKGRLVIIASVVLLAGLAGGGWFFFQQEGAATAATTAEPAKKPTPSFVPLEIFTVNLADREHYLQVGLTYEVAGGSTVDAMKQKMPILRSRILLLLSSKTAEGLSTPAGKESLARELLEEARKAAELPAPGDAISGVHFSAFVIQ